nr:universal stress protein [Actinomycetota bacterium]
VVNAIEVPLDRPLDAAMPEAEDAAEQVLDDAQAFLEGYGVRAITRLVRARRASAAIVEEAARRNAELIVIGSPRKRRAPGRAVFGKTVDHVLRASTCRVLVAAGRRAA